MEHTVFGRIGWIAARWPWLVIAFWVVLAAAGATFAGGLPARLTPGGFEVPGSGSEAVRSELRSRFTQQANATALVVVHHPSLTVDSPAYRSAVDTLASRVQAVERVNGVSSVFTSANPAYVSPDRHTTYLVAGLTGSQSEVITTAGRIQAVVKEGAPAGLDIHTGGQAAFYDAFNEVAKDDLERAELVSFPVTLLVLAIAFTSVVAAGLPLVLALVSLVVTLGGLYFLAGRVDMSIYVTNTASVIGIGVGIDYALFVVTRFREELRRGRAVTDAVVYAVATAGQTVAISGATVVVALAGMFLVDVQAFSSMAIGSMSVVAVAVLAALSLLPAVLRLAGRWVDRLRVPFLSTATASEQVHQTGFWHRWAVAIMHRPWVFALGSLVVLLAAATPFAAIRMGQPSPSMLPANADPRLATERLAAAFGAGVVGPVEIMVDTPGGAGTPANLAKIDRLTRALQGDAAVERVIGLTSLLPQGNLATYERLYAGGLAGVGAVDRSLASVAEGLANWDRGANLVRIVAIGKDAPESAAAEALVDRIRNRYIADAGLIGTARVGGATAANLDLSRRLSERLPLVVGCVLALSFVLLVMAFRSLVLPVKAIVMNLLSVGAAYGLIVALFQFGWGERALAFTSPGNIASFVPLFLFSILFGLSMDYEVFLMSRMKEEYEATGSNELAVARGLESTARTITSAALVMVTVFAAFAASRLVPFKEMGAGLAAAVFVDATLVRVVLVPAAMKLMGDWNWWMPRSLDRWLPRLTLERSSDLAPGVSPLGTAPAAGPAS